MTVFCIFTIGGYTITNLGSTKAPNFESLEIWNSGNAENYLDWRLTATVYPDERRGWSALELDETLSRITSKENELVEVECHFGINQPSYTFTGVACTSEMSVERSKITYTITGNGKFTIQTNARLDKLPKFRGKAKISKIIEAVLNYYDVTSQGYEIDGDSFDSCDDDIRWVDIDVAGLSLVEFLWGGKSSAGGPDQGQGRLGLSGNWEGLESMCVKLNEGGSFDEDTVTDRLLKDKEEQELLRQDFEDTYDVDAAWQGDKLTLDANRVVEITSDLISAEDLYYQVTETYVGSYFDYMQGIEREITISASLDNSEIEKMLQSVLPRSGSSSFKTKEEFTSQLLKAVESSATGLNERTTGWESSQVSVYESSVDRFKKNVTQKAEEIYDTFVTKASRKLREEYRNQRLADYDAKINELTQEAADISLGNRRKKGATLSSYRLVIRYNWNVGSIGTFFLKPVSNVETDADLTYGIPGDPRSVLSLSVELTTMPTSQSRIDPAIQGGYSPSGELVSVLGSKELGFNGTVTSQVDRINSLLRTTYLSQLYATKLKVSLNLSDKFYLIEENLTVSINFGGVQHWLSGLYRILEVGIQIRATAIVELTLLRIPNYSNEAEMSSGNVAEEDVGNLGIVNSGLEYSSAAFGTKEIPISEWVNIDSSGNITMEDVDPSYTKPDIWLRGVF